jgi:putative endonuclease
MQDWYVYIVQCKDGTLYTGVTTDIERRIREHNSANSVTKYTRVRQPVVLVHQETYSSRIEATRREAAIKRLSRQEKEKLLSEA